ncbi:unnamed protein product [marine sediment metagenome]|uniref:Uncharacterized protein n=1 Tax=marine sediment metagenome TaxID=412755 RepID=X1B1G7_9ZZZZ
MAFVNLKEMAKRLGRTEEEVMAYVDSGIITTKSHAHPCNFGDGNEIAFRPEKVLAEIEAKKKVKEPEPEQEEEPEPEQPTEDQGEGPIENQSQFFLLLRFSPSSLF